MNLKEIGWKVTSKSSLKSLKQCFLSEYVIFYLKDMQIPLVSPEGDEMTINGMTEGLVIDIDENYYYLGEEDGTINKVVSHNSVGIVEIAPNDDGYEPIFSLPSDEDIH